MWPAKWGGYFCSDAATKYGDDSPVFVKRYPGAQVICASKEFLDGQRSTQKAAASSERIRNSRREDWKGQKERRWCLVRWPSSQRSGSFEE
jgi:hypothetical protein